MIEKIKIWLKAQKNPKKIWIWIFLLPFITIFIDILLLEDLINLIGKFIRKIYLPYSLHKFIYMGVVFLWPSLVAISMLPKSKASRILIGLVFFVVMTPITIFVGIIIGCALGRTCL